METKTNPLPEIDIEGARTVHHVSQICGFNIVVDDKMPKDEIWFEDDRGRILQKVKVKV